MDFKDIYSKDQSGNIRVFKLSVNSYGTQSVIRRFHGLLDGNLTETTTIIKKGKNIGKSNATTHFQQALRDAAAIWKKKKDEGYFSLEDLGITITEGDDAFYSNQIFTVLLDKLPNISTNEKGVVKPMLLYEARTANFPEEEKERKDRKRTDVRFPCIVQIKRDGICTIATHEHGLTTRGGKSSVKGGQEWNVICPQIKHELDILYNHLIDRQMDIFPFHGETYRHGLTLQQINSATKKANPHSRELVLYIFDVVNEDTMQHRRDYLIKLVDIVRFLDLKFIAIVPGVICRNEQELFEIEDKALAQNYEGLVIRHLRGRYLIDGRSRDVLKMVRMDTSIVQITGVIPFEKDEKKGKFICDYDNKVFFVTPGEGFTAEDKEALLKYPHLWVNTNIEITHRGFTDDGIPRCAVAAKPKRHLDIFSSTNH